MFNYLLWLAVVGSMVDGGMVFAQAAPACGR